MICSGRKLSIQTGIIMQEMTRNIEDLDFPENMRQNPELHEAN